MKEESEKAGLNLSIHKTEIMASSPIISWQIEVEKVVTVTDFLFLGSKITADSRHETKKCLLLGRKAITNIDSVLQSRNHFADKEPYDQISGFSSSDIWM